MIRTPRIYDAGPVPSTEQRYFASLMDDIELSYMQGAASGVRVTERTAIRVVAVFACIRVIAETIASLDLHHYRRLPTGGHERYPDWLDHLLSVAPNATQTRFEWVEQMWRHFELWGRCYSRIIQGPGGTIAALQPLHPSRVKPLALPNGRLRFTFTEDNGQPTELSQDELWYMHFMSDDGTTGEAPTELGRETFGLCRALELHAARFFGNGARPGVVLESDQSLDVDTVERLRESWERIHRGPINAHRTAVLDGGVKARPFEQSTNQDSQFIAVRQFETERVCSFFRVPPHMVQLLDRATFSNVEQMSIDFRNHCIAPRCRRMELSIQRDLVPEPSKTFVSFDLNDLERGDSAARMSYLTAAIDRGILSVNEARSREGLNPIRGGDVHFFPLNMTTLEAMAKSGEPVQLPPMLAVLGALAQGLLVGDAAKGLLAAAYPQLDSPKIDAIVNGVPRAAPVAATLPPLALPAPAARNCGVGSDGFEKGNECGGQDGGGGGDAADQKAKDREDWKAAKQQAKKELSSKQKKDVSEFFKASDKAFEKKLDAPWQEHTAATAAKVKAASDELQPAIDAAASEYESAGDPDDRAKAHAKVLAAMDAKNAAVEKIRSEAPAEWDKKRAELLAEHNAEMAQGYSDLADKHATQFDELHADFDQKKAAIEAKHKSKKPQAA